MTISYAAPNADMKMPWPVAGLLAAAFGLAACGYAPSAPHAAGQATESGTASTMTPTSWLNTGQTCAGPDAASLLQWQATGTELVGTDTFAAIVTNVSPSTGEALSQNSSSFTGSISASGAVVLNYASGQRWLGQISGTTLGFDAASCGAGLGVATFNPGTIADFNSAVTALTSQVDAVNDPLIQA